MSDVDPWPRPEDSLPPQHQTGGNHVYVNAPTQVVPTSGFAVASMILGFATFVTFGVSGILAVILGHHALTETRTGRRAGHGMAITGLIFGYFAVAGWAIVAALFLAGVIGAGANS